MDNVDLWIMNSFNKISLCERMWNVDAFHTQSLNFINGNDYDDDIASFTLSKVLPCQRAGHPLISLFKECGMWMKSHDYQW